VLLSLLATDYYMQREANNGSTAQSASTHKDTILPAEFTPANPEWVLRNNVNTTELSK
jgi:hypothetical protein